ncbi:alpha-1,2-fucosyltransferase [Paenibacillus sedimenti]|uniref:Alpha-1,2-fucosyltransferase n=1 Tax=Paenibacillus sedimenti TaxID=2770274 RepID=A0A926KT80_9BACL|nr:alpha-1,2-fucosyltransferase [Paenibacillus sedimenti]MBD0381560.1 alpha-1,2-fucosyltransferase [Paenibacillus sedimenti]
MNKMISMRTLGKSGRFGNQVFQYAFLKIYASYYHLKIETSSWAGHFLFGHQDPPVTHKLPQANIKEMARKDDLFIHDNPPYVNVDLKKYSHFVSTSFYHPFKSQFCSLFQPTKEINSIVNPGLKQLRNMGNTIVGIHLRRGDFIDSKIPNYCWVSPTSWYLNWLEHMWPTLKNPVLFIASDDLASVLPDFKQYNPVTSKELIDFSQQITSSPVDVSFYPDYYLLTKCDFLAISNSTFSFSASMLNKRCKIFMRPNINEQMLIPYDPWNSKPVLKAENKWR